MFSAWDPRVLDIFLEHGLRNTPTLLYSAAEEGSMTLTSSKHQEAWSYVRSNFSPRPPSDPNLDPEERLLSPDLDPSKQGKNLFHRGEVVLTNMQLPHLRPRVLWIFGQRSPINSPELQDEKMQRTGVGAGGSGGAKVGKVEKVVVPKTAHLVMFEAVTGSAAVLSAWLQKQLQTFEDDKAFYDRRSSGKSDQNMLTMSDQWLKGVRQHRDALRPTKEKL